MSTPAMIALLLALTYPASADPAPAENGYYWIYNYPGMPGHEWAVGRWDAEFRIWIVPDDEPFEHDKAMTVGPRLYAPAPPASSGTPPRNPSPRWTARHDPSG